MTERYETEKLIKKRVARLPSVRIVGKPIRGIKRVPARRILIKSIGRKPITKRAVSLQLKKRVSTPRTPIALLKSLRKPVPRGKVIKKIRRGRRIKLPF